MNEKILRKRVAAYYCDDPLLFVSDNNVFQVELSPYPWQSSIVRITNFYVDTEVTRFITTDKPKSGRYWKVEVGWTLLECEE